MTRLLHVSDTHLGNRQYGSDVRREDFAAAFEQAIDYAIEQEVDAVIHTGDLFDTRDPRLLDLNRCIDILQRLAKADIPFYGIVGNHERKMKDQYLDLIRRAGAAERLGRSPTMVNGEVALYGIDAVTRPAWPTEDFTLEPPPEGALTLLCMHQLLRPLVPDIFTEHSLQDVLDRVNIELDAIALGDYHEPEETVVDGTKVWYAGSTERCALKERTPRSVSLLQIDDGRLTRQTKELQTRPFLSIPIEFAEGDGRSHAENVIARYEVDEKVVMVMLKGATSSASSRDIRELVIDGGAAVCRVKDDRGGPDRELAEGPSSEIQSVDRLIDEMIAEQELSDVARRVERHVRSQETATSNLAGEIETMLQEAQSDVFEDGDVAPDGTPSDSTSNGEITSERSDG